MSALSIQQPYPIFTDDKGEPLEDGYVWIGTANLDPQVNPINVYWDAALTLPAAQPIRTLAGYPSNSGTPARLYVNSDYSIRVLDKKGSLIYSAPAATERFGNLMNASQVVYDPPFTGAVQTNVAAVLSEYVSVQFFGVVGDWDPATQSGTDDTAALQAAFNTGKPVFFPPNTKCKITGPLYASSQIYMDGTSYIHPTGSGYTALTVTPTIIPGAPSYARSGPWYVMIGDNVNSFTGDGFVFGDPTLIGHTQLYIDRISVRNCNGKGLEINNLWESTVNKIEVYGCGSATEYALAIKSNVGDTTNTTVFNSITVAQSTGLTLFIQAQFCRFNFVYCEEVFFGLQKFVWIKGCVASSFGKVRIYNTGYAEAWIGTAKSTFDFIDANCDIVFDQTDGFGSESVVVNFMRCDGTISENSPLGGPSEYNGITFVACELATLKTGNARGLGSGPGGKWYVNNGKVTTLLIGQNAIAQPRTQAAADAVVFKNLTISDLSQYALGSCPFTIDNCTVVNIGGNLSAYVKLLNSIILPAATFEGDNVSAVNYQCHIYADGTYFGLAGFHTIGNVTGNVINSTINGDMTATNGGTTALGLCFNNTGCTGTVAAAFGNPPLLSESADPSNAGPDFGRGKRIDNIRAAVGSPKGWICTVSGNPGTWVSEGNL